MLKKFSFTENIYKNPKPFQLKILKTAYQHYLPSRSSAFQRLNTSRSISKVVWSTTSDNAL